MPKGNLFVRAMNRIRPWKDGEEFTGISIVDTVGGIRDRQKGIQPPSRHSEPDPDTSSWPVALGASNMPYVHSEGILQRTDARTGNMLRYEPDDPEVLSRLFGYKTALPEFSLAPGELTNPDWLQKQREAQRRNQLS